MGKHGGNEMFWLDVRYMQDKNNCSMDQAEEDTFVFSVRRMREQGLTHNQIATRMREHWGISKGAYYRRLKKVRQKKFLY